MSSLDKVEEFEQLTFKQWIALGTALGGLDNVKSILQQKMKVTVEIIRRLASLTNFNTSASERKVHNFFRAREGLWVGDDFKELILTAAQTCLLRTNEAKLGLTDLSEPANDAEIRAELPEGHVFTDVNVFLVVLAALIEAQWLNENEGVLLNTNFLANIFYVKIAGMVFTVRLRWNPDESDWSCFADRLRADQFHKGTRVFSATAA